MQQPPLPAATVLLAVVVMVPLVVEAMVLLAAEATVLRAVEAILRVLRRGPLREHLLVSPRGDSELPPQPLPASPAASVRLLPASPAASVRLLPASLAALVRLPVVSLVASAVDKRRTAPWPWLPSSPASSL
jgi:hypothetical protein